MKKIIMTGGGTAGHVMPNVALFPELKKNGYVIEYIGSKAGIEKGIIEQEGIKYFSISSGKLRRYIDVKNLSDPFKVLKGVLEAYIIIKKEKPDIVFSKGGFVSVPVVIGAYLNRVPVIAHESDITPGLANRISAPYCTKICVTFPESLAAIKGDKGVLTGTPIRAEILNGSVDAGRQMCGFADEKPVILTIGGSQGSRIINDNLRSCLTELLKKYNVAHICGKGNIDGSLSGLQGYKQFEFLGDDLKHVFAAADVVISRAGANTIFELLALGKPNLLIPLSKKSSRGDQILNAESFRKSGYSMVLEEEKLSRDSLLEKIDQLYADREKYINGIKLSPVENGTKEIIKMIGIYSK
ncbi:MAG: undecaprenyldiphospho-muramoylpentapeptide beta-N-acetylglucosaminyltransferase [Clostridiaceae bacterium]